MFGSGFGCGCPCCFGGWQNNNSCLWIILIIFIIFCLCRNFDRDRC